MIKKRVVPLLLLTAGLLASCGSHSISSSGSSASDSVPVSSNAASSSNPVTSSAAASSEFLQDSYALITFNATGTSTSVLSSFTGLYQEEGATGSQLSGISCYRDNGPLKMATTKANGTLNIVFAQPLVVDLVMLSLRSYNVYKTPIVSAKADCDSTAHSLTIGAETADYSITYSQAKISSFSLSVPKNQQTDVYSIGFYGPSAAKRAKKVKSFTVSPSVLPYLGVRATKQLNLTVAPVQAVTPTYTSSDNDVASVSSTGLVTGIKAGSAKISVQIPAEFTASGAALTQTVDVVVSDGAAYSKESSRYNQEQVLKANETPVLPSTGSQKLLVIPVEIKDYAANATAENLEKIKTTFFGQSSETSWESLASYYEKSSYGALKLSGKVTDWFDCGYKAEELSALTCTTGTFADYYQPTWTILEKAVEWYKKNNTDIADYDNNKDGIIDGVWLVYSAPHFTETNGLSQDDFWAYTYWDYSAISGTTLSATDPVGGDYCWASFDFMNEGYGAKGYDVHTYVHETGHLLGLDDYYVASSVDGTDNYGPMAWVDMMDGNIIDHDAYSKFVFGWETPYVVKGDCEIALNPASKTGESILLPTGDGWNGSAFDEYLLLEYYTPTDLNQKDSDAAYPGNGVQGFTENGVRIYHVDARLAKMSASTGKFVAYTDELVSDDAFFTQGAHSNSNSYNAVNQDFRLIQELDCTQKRNFDTTQDAVADNGTLFQSGDQFTFESYAQSFPKKTSMNDGSSFPYAISFGDQTDAGAKISIRLA
jgi:M6 family metalloprotease-like protein